MDSFHIFDGSFYTMSHIVPIFFIIVLGMVVVLFVKGILQWNKNNHAPRLTVDATVVSKRTRTEQHHHGTETAMSHMSTTYYVTFGVESGDRMELMVSGREYGMLEKGDAGKLTFQGTRYLGFERG